MAEATGLRNNALPYPIYSAPFGIVFPILDADGDLVTAAAGLDSEVSKNGDTAADCTNEATEIATSSGMYYLLLTGTELTADVVTGITKTSTSGAKTTSWALYPRKLVTVRSGTAAGGDTGYITLDASASAVDDYYNGMVCIATIDSNIEVRVIDDYTGSNKQAAVTPDWNVAPDADDTFIVKLPEGAQIPTVDVTLWKGATAPAVGDIADAVWDEAIAGHAVAGSTGAALSAATAPTAAAVADAVWEEAIADHSGTVGSTAEQLAAAGAAGDPWITALPGAYAAGTAGDIIGNLVTDVGSLVPAVAVSSTTAASVASGILAIRAYHTLDQQITSTTTSDLSSATKLWLAIKIAASDDDDEAVAFIEVVDGLTVLAQAAYTTVAHGSLTLGGVAGAWTIDVGMDEVATGLLTAYAGQMLHAECKALVAASTVAVWDGVCDVSHGIVHAVA